jgi:hypothetical protein
MNDTITLTGDAAKAFLEWVDIVVANQRPTALITRILAGLPSPEDLDDLLCDEICAKQAETARHGRWDIGKEI